MSNPLPNLLALTSIADGSAQQAAPIRNNYSAIQSVVNAILAAVGVTGKGSLLVASGGGALGELVAGTNGQALVTDSTQALGVKWGSVGGGLYRKTTTKQIVNSVAETDLLNGEITVAAGAMGTDRMLRLTAYGDWKQNSGAASEVPRFKLKLGTTTLLDTSVIGGNAVANNVNRLGWRIVCEIMNLGVANAQWATFSGELTAVLATTQNSFFATGEGELWAIGAVAGDSGVHYNGGGAGAVDTTSAQALALSVILPAASANCDITLKGALVEVV